MIRRRLPRRRLLTAATTGLAMAGLRVPFALAQTGGTPSGSPGDKVIVSHGVAIHGMPGYPADAKHFNYVNPQAPKGGSIRLGTRGSFDSFNPYILKGNPAAGISVLWETLLEESGDEASTEYGLLAETVEYPENRGWTAFTLRANARWHDGKPITAEDVVFSFDILREKGRPLYASYYGDVVKAEAVAPNKVLFTYKHANNRELPVIIGQLPVLPKHYYATREFDRTTLDVPLGSGPYKVESFETGRWIQFRRDPQYWGKDIWINVGRENFDVIRYDYYRDAAVVFEAFKGGEIELRQENIARNWMTSYDFPAVTNGQVKREEIPHELPTGMQCFPFNTRKTIFKDRRVREALGYMFDFEWSNKNLFYGMYKRNVSYFGNSELASSGLPSKEELALLEPLRADIPPEVLDKEFKLPVTDGSGTNREGARRALALLKDAGWEVKSGKLVDGKGQPMSFEMLLGDNSFERVVLPIKQSLERIGVDMRVRTVDTAQYQKRMDDFDYDMTVESFGQSLSPGNEQREFWGTAAAKQPGSRNTIGIENKAIDILIEKVIQAPDRVELITACRALDRVLLWNHFVIPNWHLAKSLVAYWNKFSRPEKTAKYRPVATDTWWVDTAKEQALGRPGRG